MNISNFIELLNAKVVNYGAISSIYDFSIDLNKTKPASAFFAKNDIDASYAISLGAYVVVSENELSVKDKEIFYLKVENLEEAIFRIFRYLCEEKSLQFLHCDKISTYFATAFGFKLLSSNVFLDFENLKNAKEKTIFCSCDENYLLKLNAQNLHLKPSDYTILGNKSLFQTSILCKNLYFKDLKFAYFYAPIFASFIDFLEEYKLNFNFYEQKLKLFDAFFVDFKNEICPFGISSRVFLLVEEQEHFDFLAKNLDHKDFKIALKNSLFCDFSYSSFEELKTFKDFTYCLVLENKEDFLNFFLPKKQELSLFD